VYDFLSRKKKEKKIVGLSKCTREEEKDVGYLSNWTLSPAPSFERILMR
jgi:hypothetical protein